MKQLKIASLYVERFYKQNCRYWYRFWYIINSLQPLKILPEVTAIDIRDVREEINLNASALNSLEKYKYF